MSRKRIFVTGGAGFIGRNLTRFLRQQGHAVTPLDNLSTESLYPAPPGLQQADVLDIRSEDLEAFDAVVHLAATKSVPKSFLSDDESTRNIAQDRHLLKICAEVGMPKVLLASSCEVYGRQDTEMLSESHGYNPMSPYAVSKAALEMHANIYRQLAPATEFSCVRLFNVYGPDEGHDAVVPRFVQDLLKPGYITIEGSGTQRRDFSYVDDIVKILAELLDTPGLPALLNIGSGETCSVIELAAMLGASGDVIRHTQSRPNEIHTFCADTRLLDATLGRQIERTEFAEGLRRCLQAASQQENADRGDAANGDYIEPRYA